MNKKETSKLFTQYKKGVSKRQLDVNLGYPQSGGKHVNALFEEKLGVRTTGNKRWELLK